MLCSLHLFTLLCQLILIVFILSVNIELFVSFVIVFLELLVESCDLLLQFQLLATKFLSAYLGVFVLNGHHFLLAALVSFSVGRHWQLILLKWTVLQLDCLILKHVFAGRCKIGRIFNRWKSGSVGLLVMRPGGGPLCGEDGSSTAGLDPSRSLDTHLLWHLLS